MIDKLDKKDKGTFVRLSDKEMQMLKILKEKYCISASALFRQMIKIKFDEYENSKINKI
jgi:hypothetical protein